MINPPLTSAWVERYSFHQSKFKKSKLETVDGPSQAKPTKQKMYLGLIMTLH